ncbi:uncharacterized protein BDZ83DRAFT_198220 [Colletotrichum acutatum]|uniref:Uncharacterized protein n=1 Tax=Glomerella acutata TaxID=27357 RepID=A0AAD8XH04_GLOAC|nr:uncharacterized protein BDZ83DRAFT_198220 [Colletotrichum acutatum]KAK1727634.1 hypothetical protein BDZ83DRAFT_198220 [Colletotrichum acutatum]
MSEALFTDYEGRTFSRSILFLTIYAYVSLGLLLLVAQRIARPGRFTKIPSRQPVRSARSDRSLGENALLASKASSSQRRAPCKSSTPSLSPRD